MSWAWSIPIAIPPAEILRPPLLSPERLRVVIPTFRDWDAARATIDSIMQCRPSPAEIVLVNDNAEPDIPRWVTRYPILFVDYPGNRGPASARNAGARLRTGAAVDWLYFTDSGCERDRDFFVVLAEASMAFSRSTVAIAAPVHGVEVSLAATPINSYMTEEAILNPPADAHGHQAIVTANAAVSVAGFLAAGGFDPSYPFAAGEDLDLGLRLRSLGPIGWASHAIVRHRFAESLDDFAARFRRYGAGNAHLQHRWRLPCMRVAAVAAHRHELAPFADLHTRCMREGYDRHWDSLREHSRRLRLVT